MLVNNCYVLCNGHCIKNQPIHLHCWNNFLIYQLPTKNTSICKFTNDFFQCWSGIFLDDYNVMPTWNLIISFFFWQFIRFSLWQLGFEGLISGLANRRDRPFCYLFSSRQGLHDLFDLKMLRAYVQIHRIKLFISARTKDDLFLLEDSSNSKNRKSWGRSDLLKLFLRTNMT